ncbi:hypothetical protein HZA98_03540 [Candidatus Woesearchaeota archaeon]|nr:hypothetical protein [Candidatus Woesearchaeota archaeon]
MTRGIFSRLFWIFEKGKAHKDLQEAYAYLNSLAELLAQELKLLRGLQREIVNAHLKQAKYTSKATGALGLSKTEFIEEELVKEIKLLAGITEHKFEESFKIRTKTQVISPLEKNEIVRVTAFLHKVKNCLFSLENIQTLGDKQKLQRIDSSLREIVALSKAFRELESHKEEILTKVDEESISPLLRRMYLSPEHHPKDSSLFLYRLTQSQLRDFEEEAQRINSCNDPNYHITWRKWWRDIHIPEKDKRTPIKDPHINVTIKLFGGPKKDIHLLLNAA